ncbi:MAG: radical SAM protein [Anaerolineae bacterium]|nr:radical SAM protein [Anaerolineae bacterium]
MITQTVSTTITKLSQMGDLTLFEPAGDQPSAEHSPHASYQSHSLEECITNVSTPKGAKPVLKSMLTTACERNCFYCPFRAGRGKTRRLTISPDEMAKAFNILTSAKKADGLFLSSGIIRGSVTTQDKLIDTIEIVRNRYQYKGYIHLKIMPGAEDDQLYRAMQLADRISVNLEAPTPERLNALAPKKDFERELLSMLRAAERIRRAHPHEKLANSVTQFVVGAVGDTDLEILSLTQNLHKHARLARAYFSAFNPVLQTPLENTPATDPMREFRLYQSSFLLRDYGWELEDLTFAGVGNLRLDVDPKLAYAQENLTRSPVDLMTAERHILMRVPNIGPKGADAILRARRKGNIRDLGDLRKLGIAAPEKAAPFILLGGKHVPHQIGLL